MRVYVEFNEGYPQLYALAIFLPTVLLTSLLVRLPSMIWSLTAYTYLPNTYPNCSDFTQRIKARFVSLPDFTGLYETCLQDFTNPSGEASINSLDVQPTSKYHSLPF